MKKLISINVMNAAIGYIVNHNGTVSISFYKKGDNFPDFLKEGEEYEITTLSRDNVYGEAKHPHSGIVNHNEGLAIIDDEGDQLIIAPQNLHKLDRDFHAYLNFHDLDDNDKLDALIDQYQNITKMPQSYDFSKGFKEELERRCNDLMEFCFVNDVPSFIVTVLKEEFTEEDHNEEYHMYSILPGSQGSNSYIIKRLQKVGEQQKENEREMPEILQHLLRQAQQER